MKRTFLIAVVVLLLGAWMSQTPQYEHVKHSVRVGFWVAVIAAGVLADAWLSRRAKAKAAAASRSSYRR